MARVMHVHEYRIIIDSNIPRLGGSLVTAVQVRYIT